MASKNKIYVSFDADDLLYFNMLKAWCASETMEFVHYTSVLDESANPRIIEGIKEKIAKTSCVIVLVSDHTVSLGVRMKTEIEKSIELRRPIIVANLNGKRSIDNDLCPTALKRQMALHISFNAKIINRAISSWPSYYEQNKDQSTGAFFFKPEVYKELGL